MRKVIGQEVRVMELKQVDFTYLIKVRGSKSRYVIAGENKDQLCCALMDCVRSLKIAQQDAEMNGKAEIAVYCKEQIAALKKAWDQLLEMDI